MAHKTGGVCPEGAACLIRTRSKRNKTTLKKEIEVYHNDSGVPMKTIEKWLWPPKKSTPKNGVKDKHTKKHTKPETKFKLNNVVEEIKAGNVSERSN